MSDPALAELVTKIYQFLSFQVEKNDQLSEASKESLTVAAECIEQAFKIQKLPSSNELLDIYKARDPSAGFSSGASAGAIPNLANLASSPLLQNLATTLLTQAASGFARAGSGSNSNDQASQSSESTATASNLGSSSLGASRPPRTRKQASRAEVLSAESFKNQGNDLMKQEKYQEALECYSQAISIDENNAIYYANRAAAASKLANHRSAIDDCLEAIEIDPSYSKAYGRMGLAYASLEDHSKAKEAYVKAVELDPTNESYRNNLAIAEEKVSQSSGSTSQDGSGVVGGLFGSLGSIAAGMMGLSENNQDISNAVRSLLTNPHVVQLGLRSLQDPRLQDLLSGGMNQPGNNNESQH